MDQKLKFIPAYTKPFVKTDVTGRTLINGVNPLKYV